MGRRHRPVSNGPRRPPPSFPHRAAGHASDDVSNDDVMGDFMKAYHAKASSASRQLSSSALKWLAVGLEIAIIVLYFCYRMLLYGAKTMLHDGHIGFTGAFFCAACCIVALISMAPWLFLPTAFVSALLFWFKGTKWSLSAAAAHSLIVLVLYGRPLLTLLVLAALFACLLTKQWLPLAIISLLFSSAFTILMGGISRLLLCFVLACIATTAFPYLALQQLRKEREQEQGQSNEKQSSGFAQSSRGDGFSHDSFFNSSSSSRSQEGGSAGHEGRQEAEGAANPQPSFFSRFWSSGSETEGSRGDKDEAPGGSMGFDGADRSSDGASSSSRVTFEGPGEGEAGRILKCEDHYAVLGLELFCQVDELQLKKEYRKKAMVVHPDKNGGHEAASEAFKKLQAAFEVISDETRRKEYDSQLRTEKFMRVLEDCAKDLFGEEQLLSEDDMSSIRVGCPSCSSMHKWRATERSRKTARWCEGCSTFHPAREGEGWFEQEKKPAVFGLLYTVGPLRAFSLSDGVVYEITDWIRCQGMSFPPNQHKASFVARTSSAAEASASGASGGRQKNGSSNRKSLRKLSEEEVVQIFGDAIKAQRLEPAEFMNMLRSFTGSEDGEAADKKASSKKRRKAKRAAS